MGLEEGIHRSKFRCLHHIEKPGASVSPVREERTQVISGTHWLVSELKMVSLGLTLEGYIGRHRPTSGTFTHKRTEMKIKVGGVGLSRDPDWVRDV